MKMKQDCKPYLELHIICAQPNKVVINNKKVKNEIEEDIEKVKEGEN